MVQQPLLEPMQAPNTDTVVNTIPCREGESGYALDGSVGGSAEPGPDASGIPCVSEPPNSNVRPVRDRNRPLWWNDYKIPPVLK